MNKAIGRFYGWTSKFKINAVIELPRGQRVIGCCKQCLYIKECSLPQMMGKSIKSGFGCSEFAKKEAEK